MSAVRQSQVDAIDAARHALGEAQDAHGRRSPEAIAAGYAMNAAVDSGTLEELRAAATLANERTFPADPGEDGQPS
jgi:hypothetical protein